ncbi:MAG: glutathione S-transferase [Pseudomonadota bacterium]
MTQAYPTLYSFRRCPYAMRARMALHAAGITCELREVVLRDKPAEMLKASPKGTVPVLVLPDGHVIDESLAIMQWALGQNDPEGWLDADSSLVSQWVDTIDGPFKRNLDRYKYPNRYGDIDPAPHRAAGLGILTDMSSEIERKGALVSPRTSLADIAAFPFVRQFANTDRDWFDIQDLPALQDWLAQHLESQRFRAIMQKYDVWQGGDAPLVFSVGSEHTADLSRCGNRVGV